MVSILKTHPWINFRLDLSKAGPSLWMLLGEAKSKCEHIAGVPLRPTTAEELHQIYLAKGVMATTAIEGNTLSEEEVRQRIEKTLDLPPSKEYLGREIDNIVEACNLIVSQIVSGELKDTIHLSSLLEYNRIALQNLTLEEEIVPGKIRTHEVGVGRYKPPSAKKCFALLERLCRFLNDDFSRLELDLISCGILKAIVAHLYMAWIHPFGDGNGRTARLLEYHLLLVSGVPSPAAHLLSNHYNATRQEYYRQLDRTSRSGGDVVGFLQYAVQGFVDGLKQQLSIIQNQQWDIVWRNYIHEKFKDSKTAATSRRRMLALDLSSQQERIPISKISQISPRVARAYASKTLTAVSRDVNDLIERGLVDKNKDGVRARRETILSFLPVRAE